MSQDLSSLSDDDLATETRAREVAFQECVAEVERRRADRGHTLWNEHAVMAALVAKRANIRWRAAPGASRPTELPPALFRMGYEWCALTLIALLDRILDTPSREIIMTSNYEPAGRGLYRMVGKPVPSDKRRRAALDLIEMIENFFADHSDMWFVLPRRRSSYRPEDDARIETEDRPSPLLEKRP